MGKIRRARTKRHIEAVKSNATDEDSVDLEDFIPNQSSLPALFPVNNLFESAEQKPKSNNAANKNDPDIGKTGSKEKSISKEDKRKSRHEKFLKKLHASKIVNEDRVASKKRQNTVITGDLNPLTQALLDIDKLPAAKSNKKKRKNTKKQKSSSSEKKRQNAQISDLEKFQQVLNHPTFKSNPLQTIDEHVRNSIKMETSN